MDKPLVDMTAPALEEGPDGPCHGPFMLSQIRQGEKDKLGNIVEEILWCGIDYIVYSTCQGVFVNFSDCGKREAQQRQAFTEICPELCELRFLTHEMRGTESPWYRLWRSRRSEEAGSHRSVSLFEHNMAQAIMLLMEDKCAPAKAIARAALEMAVVRCTNDNTIRYVMTSMGAALLALMLIPAAGFIAVLDSVNLSGDRSFLTYFVAAFFGVLGAAFSVITRVRSFQMKPCQQSNMNYLMAWIRICIGLIAGPMLYLIVQQPLHDVMINPALLQDWDVVAIIGFLGGFAERLVPTVFRRTAAALEESSGTPVQAVRRSDRNSASWEPGS